MGCPYAEGSGDKRPDYKLGGPGRPPDLRKEVRPVYVTNKKGVPASDDDERELLPEALSRNRL
jgi:hypothetical protein